MSETEKARTTLYFGILDAVKFLSETLKACRACVHEVLYCSFDLHCLDQAAFLGVGFPAPGAELQLLNFWLNSCLCGSRILAFGTNLSPLSCLRQEQCGT